MTTDFVIQLGYQALYTVVLVAAPMLLAGLIVGMAVGIFQAVTQIRTPHSVPISRPITSICGRASESP